ncbi:MAG: GNAT family N-acetyltransferase [Bacteroidota bacterium]
MLQPNFTPFPELITERLLLRKITLKDAPEIFFLRSDPTVLQFLSKEPITSIKEAEDFIIRITNDIVNNDAIMWGISLKNHPDNIIGNICFWRFVKEHYRAEIGYTLHPEFWRKGIMKETIVKVLDYGFKKIGLHSAEARINPDNMASSALLKSTGFVKEGFFKEDFFHKGKFENTAVYSRLQ